MTRPSITPAMRLAVLKLHGALVLCQLCAASVYLADVEIDHHVALIDGGAHDFATNMRPLCRACHAQKSAHEHRQNSKAKRLAQARAAHEAVLAGEPKKPGKIKSRGFNRAYRRKLNGKTERRQEP